MGPLVLQPAVHRKSVMQVQRGLARRQAWEKLKATTNPAAEALAVLQLQVQPGEKSESRLFHLPPSLWHLAVPRVVHHRRLTGVHQLTVSWGAVWSLEPAAVHRLHAPPVIHHGSPALAIYFLMLLFHRRRSRLLPFLHLHPVTLHSDNDTWRSFSFVSVCGSVLFGSVLDLRCVIDNRESPPASGPIEPILCCSQHYIHWGDAFVFLGYPVACLNTLLV